MSRRTGGVLILIVMGTIQLWDSRVFSGGAPAIAIAVLGLGLPVGTLMFVDRLDVRMGSVIARDPAAVGQSPCATSFAGHRRHRGDGRRGELVR